MPILNQMGYSYAVILLYYLSHGCVGYDPEASITGLYTGPYFDPLAPRNLTAHMEDRAVLPCTVRQLGDKSVSWVRMRDADILTVDRYTFVSDERFEAHYTPTYETWNLIIKYVQERDAGMYECQVSTEPKMSQLFSLRVVVPRVSMVPPGDRYVKAGSKVKIDCHITDVVQQPDYIFWYHDAVRVLEQRDSNIEVNVKKTGEESLMSTLTISRVRRDESGNYTCMPSNLHSSSVLLHVLNEEHPEAMKDGRNASGKMEQPIFLLLLFLISTIAGRLFANYSLPGNKGNKISIFPDTIRDQSNSSQARKFKNQNSLPSTIANPQNQSFLFSNSEIRAENANLSFAGKVVFPLHQNEQKFLFANFENQSGSVVGVELLEKYISPCDVYELKKNIKKNFLYRAGEAVKLIDLTLERSNIRTLEPRNQTLELHNRTLEFHNRALQLHNRTIEHSSINLNDETANFGASTIEMEREYYELSIADPGKWIAIHSQAEMDSNKYLNISQDFAVSINIFPYNQRIQEIGSSVSQR